MVNSAASPDDTLPALLAARARSASDGRLVLDVVAGLICALTVAVWRPAAWMIPFSIAVVLAMFGAWGIAEREISEHTDVSGSRLVRVLRIVQLMTIAIGALAGALAAFAILRVLLGTWIS